MATPRGNNKQIDQSTIPPAVRRAAEEAERLQQAHIDGQNPPAEGDSAPEPVREPEARPQPTHTAPRAQEGQPQDERPQPTHQDPPREEHKPDDSDPNAQTWQARYDSERGRARKLREDVSSMASQIDNLERLIATLQTSQPSTAAPQEMKFERKVTPEMEGEWGADFFKAVEARATELIEPIKAELNAKIEALGGNVETVSKTLVLDSRQKMMRTLDEDPEVKGWRITNDDPEFVEWLQYPDGMSGRKRHDMLLEAFNANNASRVAAFFRAFLRERSATAPQTASQPDAPAPAGKPSLEQFVAPGRVRSAPAASGQADKDIITSADITRFYADKAANRFNTPDLKAKAEAYEKDIFAAQREGRVRITS